MRRIDLLLIIVLIVIVYKHLNTRYELYYDKWLADIYTNPINDTNSYKVLRSDRVQWPPTYFLNPLDSKDVQNQHTTEQGSDDTIGIGNDGDYVARSGNLIVSEWCKTNCTGDIKSCPPDICMKTSDHTCTALSGSKSTIKGRVA